MGDRQRGLRRADRSAAGRYSAARAVPTPLLATAVLGTVGLLSAIPVLRSGATEPTTVTAGRVALAIPNTGDAVTLATAEQTDEVAHHGALAVAQAILYTAEQQATQQAAELAALAAMPDASSVPTAAADPSVVSSAGFVRPVDGPVSSPFGLRFHPILHVWKLHTGTDLSAPCGTPVKAAKAGTVAFAGNGGGDGNRVVIAHSGGLETTYNHLTSYAATPGLVVKQGQVIGYVGTTGLSTGCHLHFEVMVKGVFVDPNPFLDLAPSPRVVIPPAVAPTSSATSQLVTSTGQFVTGATTSQPAATPSASTQPSTSATPAQSSTATTSATATEASSPTAEASSPTTEASSPTTTSHPSTTTAAEPTTSEPDPTTSEPDPTTADATP